MEYASRAPEQSGPLVAVPIWPKNDGDEEESDGPSVVIASIGARYPSPKDGSKDEYDLSNNEKDGSDLTKSKRRRKGQSRLISLPLGPVVSAPGAPLTPTRSIVVGLSGILADATSLLGILQDDLTQYRRMYGLGKLHAVLPTHTSIGEDKNRVPGEALPASSAQAAPTVVARRVAREVGRKCQMNSFGGGIRPFGASIVICGVDESGVCICVTQPSGAVLASHFPFANPTSKRAMDESDEESKVEDETGDKRNTDDNFLIMGGDVTVQRRLREQLADKLSPDGSLRSSVDAVVTSLLEAQGYIENGSLIAPKGTNSDGDITDLEIVIARSDGSYKLTTAEIGAIINRITGTGEDTSVDLQ